MKVNRYIVNMVVDPDQPNLAYWSFDTLSEAHDFFNVLKKGMTACTVTLHLLDQDRTELESCKLGDEDHSTTPVGKVDYRQALKRMGTGIMTTGDDDLLIIH